METQDKRTTALYTTGLLLTSSPYAKSNVTMTVQYRSLLRDETEVDVTVNFREYLLAQPSDHSAS